MKHLVIYNHGMDSIPWGEKALALADVAERRGFRFESIDYRPNNDPDWRVSRLLAENLPTYDKLVLVGSSMGAYVATVAAETLNPHGLFLIAPAFYLPGYARDRFAPGTTNIEVFHGWRDDVVPPEHAWRFCREHGARLHLYDADHRLLSILPAMGLAFDRFLAALSVD
ncbi:alpha/beta hydrolase [Methylomonas sp. MED-D]|uniref:alpha/beta hydrolase n=1 Tax=unclassified Methylomonas TaxID=2608980 RepID=UPI0028A36FE0|nr:YqiA/YcfP family alpha/beta fold hydrolase [Methylomonas sp. MV1]MDT4332519.1 YqiA/YcfP family alpha/beta fold hydrolase [Methylomonas sp. MV1]